MDRNERRRNLVNHLRVSPPVIINSGLHYHLKLEEDMAGFMVDAVEAWWIIEQLREPEGDSIELICDNPDFGIPEGMNSAVVVVAGWTDYKRKTFNGRTVIEALRNALTARGMKP